MVFAFYSIPPLFTIIVCSYILIFTIPSQVFVEGLALFSTTNDQKIITPSTMSSSFYQRTLPDVCVAFTSHGGKNIFKSALENHGLKAFYHLMQQHHTQTEPAFCGVSTLVVVLNALAVDPGEHKFLYRTSSVTITLFILHISPLKSIGQHWKGPWRWYKESMLNCCLDLDQVKQTGVLTLKDFHCLALCRGLSVDLHYCDESSSLEDFRRAVEAACLETPEEIEGKDTAPLEVLVVSYSRKILKQTGSGHFSPIAAYDTISDHVLILDTARFKYGAHWAPLELVYEAMKPVDPDSGKSRGFALLYFQPPTQHTDTVLASTQPSSNYFDPR
jgi:glutathione gamma-glutamylcysteinyltransferase